MGNALPKSSNERQLFHHQLNLRAAYHAGLPDGNNGRGDFNRGEKVNSTVPETSICGRTACYSHCSAFDYVPLFIDCAGQIRRCECRRVACSMLYFLANGTVHLVALLSQLSANKTRQQFTNEVDTNMSSPIRYDGDRDFSVGEIIRREIQQQDSSLRNIYETRLQLAQRLEENLALHRAISLRQHQSSAPLERSRLRANGRMR